MSQAGSVKKGGFHSLFVSGWILYIRYGKYYANHCACSFFSKQVSSLFRESSLGGSEMSLKVLERYVRPSLTAVKSHQTR